MSDSDLNDKNQKITRLEEYKPFPYLIPEINIDFNIDDLKVNVKTLMRVLPVDANESTLILKGVGINLCNLLVNGISWPESKYNLNKDELRIKDLPSTEFRLQLSGNINPFDNTSLEGLYLSKGLLVTQCEAEGFRRITFHPDRPDVLSKYTVSVEADYKKYPVILSNGNQTFAGEARGNPKRHKVIWTDPYPKPSYLFALVAGNLKEVNSSYYSKSGREIIIRIHVESGDEIYTQHAIDSLKRAMKWDEDVYGLEYDLDQYNIVAVRHFNMGAMENKSLNIFNSKLVLADSVIATDKELERIESVIAHEYFHNWTGNRITCRDWFQLSLKEGLTVFRDQCFTADMHSKDLKRLEDIALLRNTQFKEDAGPTSHPVKPTEYISIDNFYTTTIYEKGAELIRMLYILLGKNRFMLGMQKYITRFDGGFATTDDFIESIFEGAISAGFELNFNIDQFSLWYSRKGTPRISIKRIWDPKTETIDLLCEQNNSSLFHNDVKFPLVIPILIAPLDSNGKIYNEELLILKENKQKFSLKVPTKGKNTPIISIFRGFSAPVLFEIDNSDHENLHLLKFDNDPFSKWEAGQSLMRKAIFNRMNGSISIEFEENLLSSLKMIINSNNENTQHILSSLINIPGFSELEVCEKNINPIDLYKARDEFKIFLGENLLNTFKDLLLRNKEYCLNKWPKGQQARRNTSLALNFLASARDQDALKEALDNVKSNSMTIAKSALLALHPVDCEERELAMEIFYERWKDRSFILDSWFSLVASMPSKNALQVTKELLTNPRFDRVAPNSIRAVLGGFSSNIPAFHALDSSGYQFLSEQLICVDGLNPITASRLVKVLASWKNYKNPFRENMFNIICKLSESNLSFNTKEIVNLLLS